MRWRARGGLELPTFWFVAVRPTLPNLARGVANRTDSASWGKFLQTAFSFIYCHLRQFCGRFLQLALHFRDSIAIQAERAKEPILRSRRIRSFDCHRINSPETGKLQVTLFQLV
jgi:hypothetical protein